MEKRILSIILAFVMLFAIFSIGPVQTHAEEEPKDTLDLTNKSVNAEQQFSDIHLRVNMLSDGNVTVRFDLTPDSDYLEQHRAIVEDKVSEGEMYKDGFPRRSDYASDELYQEAVNAYNDTFYECLDDSFLPAVEVSLTFDKAVYGLPDQDINVTLKDKTSKEELGSAFFTSDSRGNKVLTCRFDKKVYNRTSAAVTFNIDFLMYITNLTSGEAVQPLWVSSKEFISGSVYSLDDGYDDPDYNYSVIITAPASVTADNITYTVAAKADDGAYLNGKTVICEIPEGLYIDSVNLGSTKLTADDYSIVGTQFRYTFPRLAYDSSNLCRNATFKVTMRVTEDFYNKHLVKNGFEYCFVSSAFLKNLSKNAALTLPREASTTMTIADTGIFAVTVGVNDSTMGAASASLNYAKENETVELTASANEGYRFVRWESSDVDASAGSFAMPAKDVSITAVFEEEAHDDGYAKYSATLNLADRTGVIMYVNDPVGEIGSFKIYSTYKGVTTETVLSESLRVADGKYQIAIADCAAMEMFEKVSVTVKYDGVTVKEFSYSVYDYCSNKISSPESSESLRKLCRSVLDCGVNAKAFFEYTETDPVQYDYTPGSAA